MRVGIITDAFPPEVGGVQIFADQFVTHLSNSNEVEHVYVLAFTPGENESQENISIERCDVKFTPAKLLKGIQWFRKHSLNIVHSLTLYPAGLAAALCKKQDRSTRTFATVYGLDAISLVDHPVLGPIHGFMFDTLDEVLFFSDSTKEKTHQAYNKSFASRRIYPGSPTFPDATNRTIVPYNMETQGGDLTVLTVARLVKRKGIGDLITAVSGLSNVSLWIVGDGPQRQALERHVPEDTVDQITFFGEVPHMDLSQFYEEADAFCLPSVYLQEKGDIEGLGLVFLEAQQFGLPVIGTRSGGIPEAFIDGETGFLVDERAPNQIKERIKEFRDNPELYCQYSEAAQDFVKEQFAWDDCIRNHLEAYNQ